MLPHVLQPPLPEGDPADVVVGTNDWKRSNPIVNIKRAKMVWIDMKQPDKDRQNREAAVGQDAGPALLATKGKSYENWWPGMRRWHLGMACEGTTLDLGDPEIISR